MRLGDYECHILPHTLAHRLYGQESDAEQIIISERHRHRFEFNREYRERMEAQ